MKNLFKFDSAIAQNFVDHAEKHIPNYHLIIDKSIQICKKLCNSSSSIIDVGCATGETLRRLTQAGFTNLYGVDSSPDMLNYCYSDAQIYQSENLPPGHFDAILCNWTLHFVKNKIEYLEEIHKNLNAGGFLILSEKTSVDDLPVHFYHAFKSQQGVSDQEIIKKARSVRDMMYINEPNWYLNTLDKIGFKKVYIIDASWCFTTFLCLK
jgi:SAM-dependent methyltransferase